MSGELVDVVQRYIGEMWARPTESLSEVITVAVPAWLLNYATEEELQSEAARYGYELAFIRRMDLG